jgi:hypothetical protein
MTLGHDLERTLLTEYPPARRGRDGQVPGPQLGPALEALGPGLREAATTPGRSRRRSPWWRRAAAEPAGARPDLADGQAFICPRCDAEITRPEDKQLGYCCGCGDFTGLCAAGRFATYTYITFARTWHRPCLVWGLEPWEVTVAGAVRRVLFCPGHSALIRGGWAPWVIGEPINSGGPAAAFMPPAASGGAPGITWTLKPASGRT